MRFLGDLRAFLGGRFRVLVTTLTGREVVYSAISSPIRTYTASISPFPSRTATAVDYRAYTADSAARTYTAVAEIDQQGI